MSSFVQSFIYKAALISTVIYILFLFVFKSTGNKKILCLLLITLLTFLIKLPYFFLGELNPDEGEWIMLIKIWNVDFNPYISSDPQTSGIIALLPLYLFDKFIPLNYSTIKIFGTLIDLLTTYLAYRILLPHFRQNKNLLFVSLIVLYCMLNVNIEADFIAYNTEHLCIFVFTLLLYILNRMGILVKPGDEGERIRQPLLLLFIAGILMGSSLFIKLQNLPIIFILFCSTSDHFLRNRHYRDLAFFILFCFLPVIIILSTLFLNGAINDFYARYVLTNLDYTSKGLKFSFVDLQLYKPFRFRMQSLYPFLIIACLTLLLIVTNLHKLKKSIFSKDFYFFLIVFFVTLYEIMQSGNYFQHYFLLLYQPLITLFICFKYFEVRKSIVITIITLQFLFFWFFRIKDKSLFLNEVAYEKAIYSNAISDIRSKIEVNNCDKKNILVWGWNSPYYVYGKFIPVIRDFVNVHLFTHEGYLEKYYLQSFVLDIQKNKHKKILVIDDLQKRKRWKKYKFSEFIHHYNLSKYFGKITMIEHSEQYDIYVLELI